MVKKYRKRLVVVEAVLWDGSDISLGDVEEFTGIVFSPIPPQRMLVIPTLEGGMMATPGDYIIKGVHGEFYPCKPDIFEKTYEEVK